jgi:hypothetical protein
MRTKTCIIAILLAGGISNSHAQDTWTRKANFAGGDTSSPAYFSIGSKGYMGTGYTNGFKNDFWEDGLAPFSWTVRKG